jgi:hypothetical protein
MEGTMEDLREHLYVGTPIDGHPEQHPALGLGQQMTSWPQ